jgi:carbon starvation protein
LLGLLAVLACTAGFRSMESWNEHYASWTAADTLSEKMRAFIDGAAVFLTTLGVPMEVGRAFIALVAVSFALTSLDSGTRLLRYNIEEIAHSIRLPRLGGRYVASLIAVALIGFFAFYKIDGQPAGLALWSLFGSTNQVLGGLTLLTMTVYLRQRGSNYWYTFVPMVFMMSVTMTAMVLELMKYWSAGQALLVFVAASIFVLSVWLVIEAWLRFRKDNAAARSRATEAAAPGD